MNINLINLILVLSICYNLVNGKIKRCYSCRSRGDFGSCKDTFKFNASHLENVHGIHVQPCASGWCGKIIEGETLAGSDYGLATQRMCLQRGPSDSEERCSETIWNYKKVFMCFCIGDLCNNVNYLKISQSIIIINLILLKLFI